MQFDLGFRQVSAAPVRMLRLRSFEYIWTVSRTVRYFETSYWQHGWNALAGIAKAGNWEITQGFGSTFPIQPESLVDSH
ncbi:hypothetical protein VSR34_28175 [Paraburkholderia sp. JHI2823]|uniref:hypothetical protein n=1 Tax=Paraburkholderia TaxID=1822464 RepID=UPI0012DE1289|nr:hypothetical protein [Paraburkholderia mimosarum]